MEWLKAVEQLRDARQPAVLVTLAAVRGHAPREAGAKMVVGADRSWGTIGGGNLEAVATARARALLDLGTAGPGAAHHGPVRQGALSARCAVLRW